MLGRGRSPFPAEDFSDISAGFKVDFKPPEDLCGRFLARLFPWVQTNVGYWESLLRANGRIELPEVEPQGVAGVGIVRR